MAGRFMMAGPMVVLAGLAALGACNPAGNPAGNPADKPAENATPTTPDAEAAETPPADAGPAETAPANAASADASAGTADALPADAATAAMAPAAKAAPVPVAAKSGAGVMALPLKRGYYVASDTPCGKASNATTMLLRRDGIGGSRDFCAFRKIEQTGPATYQVTEACGDLQDSGPPDIQSVTYTIGADDRFTSESASGWKRDARYCAQSAMPEDWRANDISDIIG